MSVVVFDPVAWMAKFPEFVGITAAQAQSYFDMATLYLSNSEGGIVSDLTKRSALFDLLVAHIAQLRFGVNGELPSPLVGRVASASEGSVSVSTGGLEGQSPGAAWFMQTPYGYDYWTATARYRRATYVPGPRPRLSGLGIGYGLGFGRR